MRKKLKNLFSGQKKYSSLVILLLIIIFLTAVISPVLLENKKKNWDRELPNRIIRIESGSISLFKKKEKRLLLTAKEFKKDLSKKLKSENQSYGNLIQLVNENKYKDHSIEIIAPNGKLIAWSYNVAIPQGKIFPLPYPLGEAFFYKSELITYHTIIDSIHVENDIFYFVLAKSIEKNYTLQNEYYKEISFTRELQDIFLTEFEIGYNPFAISTKDGRFYSFDLLNSNNNKIGIITFLKPAPEIIIRDFKEKLTRVQSVFIALACIFIFMGFRKDYKKLKYRSLKITALFFYCAIFRGLIYFIGFPSNLLSDGLTNASYYSSIFAGGMVKSPAEFLITNIFVFILSIQIHRQVLSFIRSDKMYKIRDKKIFTLILLITITLILLLIRGWGAAVKSIIFDSTLRYFKDTTLIQNLPSFVMNLNSFALGFSIIIIIMVFLQFIFNLPAQKLKIRDFTFYLIISIVSSFIFVVIQPEPLFTIWMLLIIIAIVIVLFYFLHTNKIKPLYKLISIAAAGSLITILLLNYFNLELEKRSLKTTALELNRPDNNYYKFLLSEAVSSAVKSAEVKDYFLKKETNASSIAFQIWSSSPLQKEPISSSIAILDQNLNKEGYFKAGDLQEIQYTPGILNINSDNLILHESLNGYRKNINGILPVIINNKIAGYITATIEMDINNLNTAHIPPFLESKRQYQNSAVDINQLKIFLFDNRHLVDVFGDIYPSRDQMAPIFKANYSAENEAWLTLNLNNEEYLAYFYKTNYGGNEKITAVLLKVKHISLDLFNFFKIFIVHSLFILILLVIIFITRIRTFQYTFRAQLLTSFLFISILPIIILAIYNRQTVTKRINESIKNELSERTGYIDKFVQSSRTKNLPGSDSLFNSISNELGISYSVYDGSDLIYSSKKEIYNAGILPLKLDPIVYYNLNYLSYREYSINANIDDFPFTSFYKKITIGDKSYTFEVSSAFNNIYINLTASDVDVFLFGIYTLAMILVIIASTIIANRISRPITVLTHASKRIAVGDLNTEVENFEKGEIKNLIDGFNLMIKELRQNQNELAELERENAWKEMARQVAHEIKNPLTPMKLALQQLIISFKEKRANLDVIFEKLTGTILSQIDNLNNIASEFSRFGRMPLFNLEKIEVLSVINDSAALFSNENLKIQIKSSEKEIFTDADRNQFRRFLINMFRNSFQADATSIMVNIKLINSQIEMYLTDNGTGIPDKFKERIFDPNFTSKEKGMGIGLKLSKRFIEGINGKIELYETSSKGTTFRIVLPAITK